MRIPTDLQGICNPTLFLQIFNQKVRTGFLTANHKLIHKIIMEQYIHSVGQIFVAMGEPDPRLNTVGAIDFHLGRQFSTYMKEYHPPYEYTHYQYPSSIAWTQLPKADLPDTKQYTTSPGLNYSSCSDPASTASTAQTPSPPPSPYETPCYLWTPRPFHPPQLPPTPVPTKKLLSSSLKSIKIASK